MPKFWGYDLALVVTCGSTSVTRVFPCTKHVTVEETIKILPEEWFCVYGATKELTQTNTPKYVLTLAGAREP